MRKIWIDIVGPAAITASDLSEAAAAAGAIAARWGRYSNNGYRATSEGQAVYLPREGRGGVSAGGAAVWTDARGVHDAIRRVHGGRVLN